MDNKLVRESPIAVSVIMPSLNVATYIEECLGSVISQTLKEIEILCIDAGSTDGTLEIIERYASEDSRIRLIKSDKKSYGYQVNLGIQEAGGQYIGIVETDDYIDKSMYQTLYSYADPCLPDFIKGGYTEFADVDKQRIYGKVNRDYLSDLYGQFIDFDTAREKGVVDINHIWSGIYRRDFLSGKGIRLNETAGASYQDLSFSILTGLLADTGMYVNESCYYYRIDNENSSVKSSSKWRCVMDEFEYIERELEKRNVYTSEIKRLVWMQKPGIYFWNILRLSGEGKERFLSEIRQELREFSEEGFMYGHLDEVKKSQIEMLANGDMLGDYLMKRQEIKKEYGKLSAMIEQGEKFVLVCAGRYSERLLLLQEIIGIRYVKAVADNNTKLQGKVWNEYSVISVSEAVQKYKNARFLIANKNHSEEIREQLRGMGISRDKIFALRDMLTLEEMLDVVLY